MKNLYFLIENYWFKLPQQLRFVLLGGFNTLLSYLIFVFLIKIAAFSYQFSLIAQYLITVNISIFSIMVLALHFNFDRYRKFLSL